MLRALTSMILIVLVFLSTLGYVGHQLTQPDFLVGQAERVHLYEQTTTQIQTLLPKDSLKGLPFSPTDIQTIIGQAVDAQTFYSDLGGLIGAYSDWLTGRSAALNYQLNLAPIKTKLVNQASSQLVADYQGLPICTTAQLKTWNATNGLPSCQLPPSNIQSRDVNSLLDNQVGQFVNQIPDKTSLPKPTPGMVQARARVIQVLQLIKFIWLATAAFILLYALIGRRKAFFSLAIIFLVAGLLEIAFSFVAWDWLKRLIIDLVNKPDQSQQIVTIVSTIVSDAIETLKTLLGNISIFTLAAGGLFLILWAFTLRYRAKNQLEVPKN